jgi:DNA-directed RNA polymerase specialized sigma subunit
VAATSPIHKAVMDYKTNPSVETKRLALKHMTPVINKVLASIGSASDPLMKNKAKVFAIKAIDSFNPDSGNSPATWISRNLMQLGRFKRETQNAVKIPERIQLDNYSIDRGSKEFLDERGREPDETELADYIGMSQKRIAKVRSSYKKVSTEGAFGEEGLGSEKQAPDYSHEAMEYIYNDLDNVDKKIMELRMGYGNKNKPVSHGVCAQMLGLTPPQLTRRSTRIAMKISNMTQDLGSI